MHPLSRDYTCQETSRIDMIFLSGLLDDRIIKVRHKKLETVKSDHKMVIADITLNGLFTPPRKRPYKKPKGWRFLLRETSKEDWEVFEFEIERRMGATGAPLEKLGLKRFERGGDNSGEDLEKLNGNLTAEDLEKVDITQAWRWYSSQVKSACEVLPKKKVGGSGIKPEREL
ncbi:hypothetical protein BGX20_005248, partial [Mortierella sp. AD010]